MAKQTMKLGEALTLLKTKKGRLASLQNNRSEQFYVDVGKKPSFTYQELTEEIKKESGNIVALKLAIQEANLKSRLAGGTGMTIAEGIIRVGEFRSALANLEGMIKQSPLKRKFWDTDKAVDQAPQVEPKEIDRTIQELSAKKSDIDNKLQTANWKVDVTVELS